MADVTYDTLAAQHRRAIDQLRPDIRTYTQRFGLVQEQRSALAPRFMQAYNRLAADTPCTFVQFVRLFDATVPTGASGENGYRRHKTYMAADYLKRLVNQRPRGQQGVRDSAADGLARTIATILQVVRDPEPVFAAIQAEFRYNQRVMTGLRRRVAETRPLFQMAAPRPLQVGNVVHMDRQPRAAVAGQAAPQAGAQAGRARGHGRRRAA